jgi:hypothetical protein
MTQAPASPALTEADQAMQRALELELADVILDGGAISPRHLAARLIAGPLATLRATLREREAEIERLRTALNKIAGNAGYGRQTYAADGSETGQSLSRCWGIVEDFARAALAQPERLPGTATGGETPDAP